MNQPGLDITVFSGGPHIATATNVAYQLCTDLPAGIGADTRVRKITVQAHSLYQVVGGISPTPSRVDGAQKGIELGTRETYTFHNVKPADIWFVISNNTYAMSYLIEM